MPTQRPPTAEEAAYYSHQGIDPSNIVIEEGGSDEPSPETSSKNNSVLGTIAKTGAAHAGSYVGAGGMMALGPFNKLGLAAGALTGPAAEIGVPVGGLIGSGIDAMIGSYLGQKGQETIGGQSQQNLEKEAEEAEQEHPIISAATDITGSALAGGGSLSLKNLQSSLEQLLGRNALSLADRTALSEIGTEALSPQGVQKFLADKEGKEALMKVALSSVVNPAINTGLDVATGHTPTIGGMVSQFAGGALFSEPSRLGQWMHSSSHPQDEPVPETSSKDITEIPTSKSIYTQTDEGGEPSISDKLINDAYEKVLNRKPGKIELGQLTQEDGLLRRQKYNANQQLPVEQKRALLEADYLSKQNPSEEQKTAGSDEYANPQPQVTGKTGEPSDTVTDISKPTVPAIDKPNITQDNKPVVDEEALNKQAEEHLNAQEPTANEKASLVEKQAAANKAVNDLQIEQQSKGALSGHPDVVKAQEIAQNALREVEEYKAAMVQKQAESAKAKPIEPVNSEPSNMMRILNKDTLLPQLNQGDNIPKVVPSKEDDASRYLEIRKQMVPMMKSDEGVSSPEFQSLWKESEDIKNRNKGFVPGTEPKETEIPLTKTEEVQEDWDTKLAKMKIDTNGKMYDALQGIPVAVWNGSIDAIRFAVRTGKAIHEAVKDGIAWIKANHPNVEFDEGAYTKKALENIKEKEPIQKQAVAIALQKAKKKKK